MFWTKHSSSSPSTSSLQSDCLYFIKPSSSRHHNSAIFITWDVKNLHWQKFSEMRFTTIYAALTTGRLLRNSLLSALANDINPCGSVQPIHGYLLCGCVRTIRQSSALQSSFLRASSGNHSVIYEVQVLGQLISQLSCIRDPASI